VVLGAARTHSFSRTATRTSPTTRPNARATAARGEGWFEDARAGLNGPPGFLTAWQRRWQDDDEDRLAIEFVPQEDGAAQPFRCSIPAAFIRNLARHLNLAADVRDGWREPRHVRHSLTN
jgi:hypothetical protein